MYALRQAVIICRNRNIPYRHGDDSLLEEVTSRMANKKHPPLSTSRQGFNSDPTTSIPSDIDIMQTMISRIAILEKQSQLQSKQLLDKVVSECVSSYRMLSCFLFVRLLQIHVENQFDKVQLKVNF